MTKNHCLWNCMQAAMETNDIADCSVRCRLRVQEKLCETPCSAELHRLLLPTPGNKEPKQMLDFQQLPQTALFKGVFLQGTSSSLFPHHLHPSFVCGLSTVKQQGFSGKRNALKWCPPRNEEYEWAHTHIHTTHRPADLPTSTAQGNSLWSVKLHFFL